MGTLLRDFRFSLRLLLKDPVFSIVAVATLALGIGLNAATFSTVSGLLLRPLAGAEAPAELIQVYRHWAGIEFGSDSIPHYQDIRDQAGDVFESTAAWFFAPMSLSAEGRSERLMGTIVSANFFQTYGAVPALGRAFLPGEEDKNPGAHPVAVLGHGFWQTRFGGDSSIVGRAITLNGSPFEVVGIAPPSFKGPVGFADIPIYVPIMMQREIMPGTNLIEARGNNMMTVVARLRDGTTIEQAQQSLDRLLVQQKEQYPEDYENQLGTTLVRQTEAGIHPSFRGAQVGLSAVIMVVVSLLLLIACVNVANLFLARARERRREMGLRLSLGASRRRVIQQVLTESLLFSLLAGAAGVVLAYFSVGLLARVKPPIDGPFAFAIEVDSTVLWFTLLLSLAAGVLFGMAPALQAARRDTISAIKGEASQGKGRSRLSSALVVAQIALSLLLLIGSGLFLRSLKGATEIDPGFRQPKHLVMASIDPGLQGYDEARARGFFDRLLAEVSSLPEVEALGLTDSVPLGLSGSDRGVGIPGYEFAEGERRSLQYAKVTEGYLETLGVGVVEGRLFTRQDDENGAPVIVVNRRFADRFWPGESALGKSVETAGREREVVGVVENGKYRSLGEEPTEFMYLPQRELFEYGLALVARTRSSPEPVLRQIRETVRGLDPQLPLFDVRTMEDHMGIALLPARLGGVVLGAFGILGLVLAAVGIYGSMAYSVAQRKRELGLRIALGANQSQVLKQMLGEGLRLALVGAALGLVAAIGATRLVVGMLYNVSALDPVAFVAIPLVLLAVATLAVYLPARKAATVDPMKVLKVE